MPLNRRRMLASLAAGLAGTAGLPRGAAAAAGAREAGPPSVPQARPLRRADGSVDWDAVRELFPLAKDWTHLAGFLFVSHPRPVAEAIERFRRLIDADPYWVEIAAFTPDAGRPYHAVKRALAEYVGGSPDEICLTTNTTTALAMAYQGLRVRADQEIVTTEHDHFSHHESIRYSAMRSGCGVRYVPLYDAPAQANAAEMVARVARAITPRTRAVGLTWVHSSSGVIVPIAEIAAAVAQANRGRAAADRCLLIVDGVHGFANQDVDIAALGCDFFASGTHKWLFAPRGTGFLWGRGDVWPELRPTIPNFDPDGGAAWQAWGERAAVPPMTAAMVSPGGFVAYEHVLAIPAAVELHRAIGRPALAGRIAELNAAFREGAARLPHVTLHTPRDPALAGGISCFDVAGLSADAVMRRLAAQRIRTSSSPYVRSYARVSLGVMNSIADVERALGAIRAMG